LNINLIGYRSFIRLDEGEEFAIQEVQVFVVEKYWTKM